jgi:hypothetical protein
MSMHVRWLIPLGTGAATVAQVAYAAQYMTIAQAQHAAFPAATAFAPVQPALGAAMLAGLGAPTGWSPKIWEAHGGDQRLGWMIEDQVIGKSELITYALALDADGLVLSVEVLDYRESHGGEIRLLAWRKQFVGKSAHDPVALNRDIKNISGATLSCRHITEGVQRLLQVYERALRHADG